jgi:hypothetical protein
MQSKRCQPNLCVEPDATLQHCSEQNIAVQRDPKGQRNNTADSPSLEE